MAKVEETIEIIGQSACVLQGEEKLLKGGTEKRMRRRNRTRTQLSKYEPEQQEQKKKWKKASKGEIVKRNHCQNQLTVRRPPPYPLHFCINVTKALMGD